MHFAREVREVFFWGRSYHDEGKKGRTDAGCLEVIKVTLSCEWLLLTERSSFNDVRKFKISLVGY